MLKNILMVVNKNSACLDYTLPILHKLKKQCPDTVVNILYTVFDKNQIVKKSKFLGAFLDEIGADQCDEQMYLPIFYKKLNLIVTKFILLIERQKICLDLTCFGNEKNYKILRYITTKLKKIRMSLSKKVEYNRIMLNYKPDIILFDNTYSKKIKNNEYLEKFFQTYRKRVFLLPHAPHHGNLDSFTPFITKNDPLPNICEFWMPFKFERPWKSIPEKREQFFYTGYPGLDSDWLEYVRKKIKPFNSEFTEKAEEKSFINCVFIIRRFLNENDVRKEGDNEYVYSYEEFVSLLKIVSDAILSTKKKIRLIIKPHPSNTLEEVRKIFKKYAGTINWVICVDPIYSLLPITDIAISLYSTVPIITAMSGILTIILNSSTQEHVHKEKRMRELYESFTYFLTKPERFVNLFGKIINQTKEQKKLIVENDIKKLRYFYPDGATQVCIRRLLKTQ